MISAAENGHKAMRPENIIKISACLDISTDYLLKGEDTVLASLTGTTRLATLSEKQRNALQDIVNTSLSMFECAESRDEWTSAAEVIGNRSWKISPIYFSLSAMGKIQISTEHPKQRDALRFFR